MLDGDTVLIRVTDHGPGIPVDQLQRIFERFHQVDSSDSRPKEGSGLGLAIARGIVEHHGGHISVFSELGHGATFSIDLPLLTLPDPAVHAEAGDGARRIPSG